MKKQKSIIMKKILYYIATLLILCGSCNERQNDQISDNNSVEYYFSWEELSPEDQLKHFDSFAIVLQEVNTIIDTLKLNNNE